MEMTLHCGRLAYTAGPAAIAELESLTCWEWLLNREPVSSPERVRLWWNTVDSLRRLEAWGTPNWVVNTCMEYARTEDIRRLGAGEALRRMTH